MGPAPPTLRGRRVRGGGGSRRELIEAHPEYAGALYNLACCESLAGRTADAIEHLQRAVDGSERFRSFAEGDSDFDPIRDQQAFKELISHKV